MTYYRIQEGSLIEGFETLTGWSVSGTGGEISLDTTNYKSGSGALKIKSVNNVSAYAKKTVSLDLSKCNVFTCSVYINDITKYSQVLTGLIYLYTGASDYFYCSIRPTTMVSGWNKLIFTKADFLSSGSPSWSSTVTEIRIRCLSGSGNTSYLTIDSLLINEYSRPKIIITFDDGNLTDYTVAYPYMISKGIKGVSCIPCAKLGITNNMTDDQVSEMVSRGWEVINHSYNHVSLVTLTGTQITEELINDIEYIRNHGWGEGGYFMAWPFSAVNETSVNICLSVGMKACRTGNAGYDPHDNTFPILLKRQEGLNDVTVATMKSWIDSCVAGGSLLIINFHDLVNPAATDTDVLPSDFYALIDYIHKLKVGNILDVVTFSEWYNGLISSRRLV